MNTFVSIIKVLGLFGILILLVVSCSSSEQVNDEQEHKHEEGKIHLSLTQYKALGVVVDTLPSKNMNSYVETNGKLTLPPQSEASVSAILGGNISDIRVIQGDKVQKGQILATMSHPDILNLQTEYVNKSSELEYLQVEFERQQKLYNEKINSGREFQKTKADYKALKSEVKGLRSSLRLLNLDPERLDEGNLYEKISVKSPIDGYIRTVEAKIGKYFQAQDILFEIVNNSHIHAHFLVFEKDINKVKVGQKVLFTLASMPGLEKQAEIFSVGKVFEQEPRAVEVHAELENKKGDLISGMYAQGKIIVSDDKTKALPEEAVVREGEKHFVFRALTDGKEWEFEPLEVITENRSDGWVEIKFLQKVPSNTLFAHNSAYYILSEWKKEEAGHGHSH